MTKAQIKEQDIKDIEAELIAKGCTYSAKRFKEEVEKADIYERLYHIAFDRGLVYERIAGRVFTKGDGLLNRIKSASLVPMDLVILGLDGTGYDADHFNRALGKEVTK